MFQEVEEGTAQFLLPLNREPVHPRKVSIGVRIIICFLFFIYYLFIIFFFKDLPFQLLSA